MEMKEIAEQLSAATIFVHHLRLPDKRADSNLGKERFLKPSDANLAAARNPINAPTLITVLLITNRPQRQDYQNDVFGEARRVTGLRSKAFCKIDFLDVSKP